MTVINEYEFDIEHNQLSMQVDDINGLITHVIQCRESVPNWRTIYNSLVDEQQAVYDKLNLLLATWRE